MTREMTVQEYREKTSDGFLCPFCGVDSAIVYTKPAWGAWPDEIVVDHECKFCRAMWTEVYGLERVTVQKEGIPDGEQDDRP